MTTAKPHTHYRLVNLEPNRPDYVLCTHSPDDGRVNMSSVHDDVTCGNCRDENVASATSHYLSLVNARR